MNHRLIKKFAERYSFDEGALIDTLKATAFKVNDGVVTDAQMMALLIVADQYGLNPFTKEIYAFPDKKNGIVPVVGIDGWSRIINGHSAFDGMTFHSSETIVTPPGGKPCPEWMDCALYRKDRAHPIVIREYLDEVYREPFQGNRDGRSYAVNGPWQSHTKRLLRHKATIQAARMAFGFVGIYDQDEAERILEGQSGDLGDPRVIPIQGEPSDQARKVSQKLIQRAEKAHGAWNAAIEYASEHFDGADLAFVNQEIWKAETDWKKAKGTSVLEAPPESPASVAFASVKQMLGNKAA
ncbi:MAG: phage recombination protein Bet [Gammaproteobacteria bacterium]|nr:phage recombination protein Bet [Gammaproteobacteria bacterium]NBT44079.1 phage recombination protein Bet [Gammaproteobacteria bacterium]NBY21351.1 phage recombination protein Bet [Gammaproteobacteria bacterium]